MDENLKLDDKYCYQENLEIFGNSRRQVSLTFPVYILNASQSKPSHLARTNHPLCPRCPTSNLLAFSYPPSPFPDSCFTWPDPVMSSQATVWSLSLFALSPAAESPRSSPSQVPLQCFLTCSQKLPARPRPLSKWSLPLLQFPFPASASVPHSSWRKGSSPFLCTTILGSHI